MVIDSRRNISMTNELEQFQNWVELNDVQTVQMKINELSTDTVKLVNTQVNGKTCIDIATEKNVGLEMWKLLLKYFTREAIFGKYASLNSFEKLLQSPPSPGNSNDSVTPSHQMHKVEHFLGVSRYIENENIKQLRVRYLCDLCRVQPSSNASEADAFDVYKLATLLLMSYGVDILNSEDMLYGLYPIHMAVRKANIPLLRLFINFGGKVNYKDSKSQGTALHHIQGIKGHANILEIVNILINHGASLYFERKQRGYTALHSILINLSISDVNYFLSNHKQTIATVNESMPFPAVHGLIIHTATSNGQEDEQSRGDIQVEIVGKIKFLYQQRIDIHTTDINGMNILHYACWFRYTELVKYLLSAPFVHLLLVGDNFGRGCFFYASDKAPKIWLDEKSLTRKYLHTQNMDNNTEVLLGHNGGDLDNEEIGKPVDLNSRNSKDIIGPVQCLVNKLETRLNKCVPNYLDTVTLSGSVSEGTKINPLDEFDFLFKLKEMSQDVSADSFTFGDEVCLKSGTTYGNQTLNQYLCASFNSRVYEILQEKTFWNDLPFYWRTCYHLEGIQLPDSLVAPLRLKLIRNRPRRPDLDVDIDLVPVIVLNDLPAQMKEQIPPRVVDFITTKNLKWDVILRGKTENARLSFSSVEKFILRRLMPEIKDAYILAKRVLSRVVETRDIKPEIITSYMFKNALFHELDPEISYCLLDECICPRAPENTQTPANIYHGRELFVNLWTLKILNRLITLFSKGNDVKIYCRPSVGFPDCSFFEDDDENDPYIKVLTECKTVLSHLQM